MAEILDEWEPEPLGAFRQTGGCRALLTTPSPLATNAVPAAFSKLRANMRDAPNAVVVEEALDDGKQLLVEGSVQPVLNCGSKDFLALSCHQSVKAAAVATMEEYTYGSCGPRGFYGSTMKHLELEAALADFMGTPESITYSDATAAVASAIPAFSKRGDLLVVDDGANHAMQTGIRLSRSTVVTYKHNDLADLERVLADLAKQDAKAPGRAEQHRRFIVFEGLSATWGDVAPLPGIVELAAKFKLRTIMDDSLGWGVLGSSGRGTAEYHGLHTEAVDVTIGSLSSTLASPGGFVVGSRDVTDHQRLSGAGYVFSASTPPSLCATAIQALTVLRTQPELLEALKASSKALKAAVVKAGERAALPAQAVKAVQQLASQEGLDTTAKLASGLWRVVSCAESPVAIVTLVGAPVLAVRAVASAVGIYRQAQDKAAARRAARNLATPHAARSLVESLPRSDGSFFRPAAAATTEEAAALISNAAAATSLPAGSTADYAAGMLSLAAESAELEVILDAIVREAVAEGVLFTRAHTVPGDNLGSLPALRVSVKSNFDKADIDKATLALTHAVQVVTEKYVALAVERIAAIRKACSVLLAEGAVTVASAGEEDGWCPPPVLLHVSALTDVPSVARAIDSATARQSDVLYADPLVNAQLYSKGSTPASRKASDAAASAASIAREADTIQKECLQYEADASKHTGRVNLSVVTPPTINMWLKSPPPAPVLSPLPPVPKAAEGGSDGEEPSDPTVAAGEAGSGDSDGESAPLSPSRQHKVTSIPRRRSARLSGKHR